MKSLTRLGVIAMLGFVTAAGGEARAESNQPVRIGMIQTMFRDVPDAYVSVASNRFSAIVKRYTGMPGQIELTPDAETQAQRLKDGTLHAGVFHGFEYAQVRQKYPELLPLVVAVPTCEKFQANLIVRADADVTDLAGKSIAVPKGTREHCRAFLAKHHPDCKIVEPETVATALDDVVDGIADGAVVDASAMRGFENSKPGRAKQLKVLSESEEFPLSVIVYRKGGLTAVTMQRFRDGLMRVHTSTDGKFMLRLWKLSKFAGMPADYSAQLARILKAYPATETVSTKEEK